MEYGFIHALYFASEISVWRCQCHIVYDSYCFTPAQVCLKICWLVDGAIIQHSSKYFIYEFWSHCVENIRGHVSTQL